MTYSQDHINELTRRLSDGKPPKQIILSKNESSDADWIKKKFELPEESPTVLVDPPELTVENVIKALRENNWSYARYSRVNHAVSETLNRFAPRHGYFGLRTAEDFKKYTGESPPFDEFPVVGCRDIFTAHKLVTIHVKSASLSAWAEAIVSLLVFLRISGVPTSR